MESNEPTSHIENIMTDNCILQEFTTVTFYRTAIILMGNPSNNKRPFDMEQSSNKRQKHMNIRIIKPESLDSITLLHIQTSLPVLKIPPTPEITIPVSEPSFQIQLTDCSTKKVHATYDSANQSTQLNIPE